MDSNIIGTMNFEFSDFSWVIKIPMVIVIVGLVFYNFMMFLRIRILADTVDSNDNATVKKLSYAHTIISILLSLVSLVLILLG